MTNKSEVKASFTPGPWRVCPTAPKEIETAYRSGAGALICSAGPLAKVLAQYGDLDEQRYANAHLIAAGPTMFLYVEKQAAKGDQDAIEILRNLR